MERRREGTPGVERRVSGRDMRPTSVASVPTGEEAGRRTGLTGVPRRPVQLAPSMPQIFERTVNVQERKGATIDSKRLIINCGSAADPWSELGGIMAFAALQQRRLDLE
jgi:hypothetical protein